MKGAGGEVVERAGLGQGLRLTGRGRFADVGRPRALRHVDLDADSPEHTIPVLEVNVQEIGAGLREVDVCGIQTPGPERPRLVRRAQEVEGRPAPSDAP